MCICVCVCLPRVAGTAGEWKGIPAGVPMQTSPCRLEGPKVFRKNTATWGELTQNGDTDSCLTVQDQRHLTTALTGRNRNGPTVVSQKGESTFSGAWSHLAG